MCLNERMVRNHNREEHFSFAMMLSSELCALLCYKERTLVDSRNHPTTEDGTYAQVVSRRHPEAVDAFQWSYRFRVRLPPPSDRDESCFEVHGLHKCVIASRRAVGQY